jgi:DNA-binding NarL/FixJ family response regulator
MKVLLVDDHPLFLEGLQNLLLSRGIEVVGTAGDGLEALEKARALHPDVILMDVQMPRCDGLAATRLIKVEMPEVKIVMLTVCEEDEDLFEAIKSGASGYLLKSLDAREFFELLSGLAQGEAPLSPGLAARILEEFAHQANGIEATPQVGEEDTRGLTPRQMGILILVARGLTYKRVGATLCLSERTVKYHMGEILGKLHLENRTQVIAWATRAGLVKSSAGLNPRTERTKPLSG